MIFFENEINTVFWIGFLLGAMFTLSVPVLLVFALTVFYTVIDTHNFIFETKLQDGYNELDKLWIMPRLIPKFILARFLRNLGDIVVGWRR